ncbi:MAG: hypothetical protein FJ271_05155 [Planctomycetes bacterium]|nr:hypothetical protein [Planctomycetota bacterium]
MTCSAISPTIQCLVELLGSDHTLLRMHGVRTLAQLGPVARPALAALSHATRDRNRKVRRAAAEALASVARSA